MPFRSDILNQSIVAGYSERTVESAKQEQRISADFKINASLAKYYK